MRLLSDAAFIAEFDIVVDEISIRYVAGGFEGEEKERVERYFLRAPERQQKARVVSELLHRASTARSEKPAERPAPALAVTDSGLFARVRRLWSTQPLTLGFATTVAMLVIVAGVVWLGRSGRPTAPNFATLTLTNIEAERGEQTDRNEVASVTIQPGNDELQIKLLLPSRQTQPQGYHAKLAAPASKNLTIISQDGDSVLVTVPTSELKPDRYAIFLFAVDANGREERIRGSYIFRVQ
jgi:hypothetical protein